MGWMDLENSMLNDAYWDRPQYEEYEEDYYYDYDEEEEYAPYAEEE